MGLLVIKKKKKSFVIGFVVSKLNEKIKLNVG